MIDHIKRNEIIDRARQKYIVPGITKNITEALKLYLENDAEANEQIPLFITTPEIHQLQEILKERRPQCDECDAELHLQVNAHDPTGKTYPTAWICKNCGIEYYSDKIPAGWLEEIRLEARKQNLRKPDELIETDVPAGRTTPEI